MNKPDLQVFSNSNGSNYTKDFTCYKTEGMCRKKLKLSAILKAIYEPVYKLVVEKKSLATYKMKETSHKNAFLMYYAYKAQGKFN